MDNPGSGRVFTCFQGPVAVLSRLSIPNSCAVCIVVTPRRRSSPSLRLSRLALLRILPTTGFSFLRPITRTVVRGVLLTKGSGRIFTCLRLASTIRPSNVSGLATFHPLVFLVVIPVTPPILAAFAVTRTPYVSLRQFRRLV